ncbi:MAG: hypothetical protein ACLFVU_05700 [Phycisphaerae bacterium]
MPKNSTQAKAAIHSIRIGIRALLTVSIVLYLLLGLVCAVTSSNRDTEGLQFHAAVGVVLGHLVWVIVASVIGTGLCAIAIAIHGRPEKRILAAKADMLGEIDREAEQS